MEAPVRKLHRGCFLDREACHSVKTRVCLQRGELLRSVKVGSAALLCSAGNKVIVFSPGHELCEIVRILQRAETTNFVDSVVIDFHEVSPRLIMPPFRAVGPAV